MRAMVLEGRRQLAIKDVEKPQVDGSRVLIKLSRIGICGSDIHLWKSGEPKGMIMGHEFCGTIEDPGALKGKLKVGDRVTALPMNPCGKCTACKKGLFNICEIGMANAMGVGFPGAYTEYMALRSDLVRTLPDSISDDEAAMIEPAAVALRGVRQAGIKTGDKVLIIGGGIIGLLCAAWTRMSGASYIALSDINKQRMSKAKEMGDVDEVFDAKEDDIINNLVEASGGGFDVVLECTGSPTAIDTAVMAVKPAKRIILVGVSFVQPVCFNTLNILFKELDLKASCAYTDEFDICINLFAKKRINLERFISDTVGFADVQEAFKRLASKDTNDIKILIDPLK